MGPSVNYAWIAFQDSVSIELA